MEKVISLLEERNSYLTKFLVLAEEEATRFAHHDFDGLDEFYRSRETILEIVQQIEKLIDNHLSLSNSTEQVTPRQREQAQVLLAVRDEIINQILGVDLKILALIESAKNRIIRDLQVVRQGKRVVGRYHSGSSESQLDEEA